MELYYLVDSFAIDTNPKLKVTENMSTTKFGTDHRDCEGLTRVVVSCTSVVSVGLDPCGRLPNTV